MCTLWPPYVHTLVSIYAYFGLHMCILWPPYVHTLVFEDERAYCFAHVDRPLRPYVTFSIPIKNSITTEPTFLKLSHHIRPVLQRNPTDFVVTGSTVTLVKYAKTVSDD